MLRATIITLVALFALAGCQQEQAAEAPKEPEKKAEAKDGASAIANGAELQVNPNGKIVEPGSALGKK